MRVFREEKIGKVASSVATAMMRVARELSIARLPLAGATP